MPKVLMIDDNHILASFTVQRLESAIQGLESTIATNCNQARKEVQSHIPDLIVLDRNLPDGDGFQLLKELRPTIKNTPVIMVSADLHQECSASGVSLAAYLVKPFESKELIHAVKRSLEISARQKERSGQHQRVPTDIRVTKHRLVNRLSALIAGVRAFEADIRAEAEDPIRIRAISSEYADKLVLSIRELAEMLSDYGQQQHLSRGEEEP